MRVLAAAFATFLLLTAGAAAHPDHGSNLEEFPGEGVAAGDQHARAAGALAPVRRNVRLVGKAAITNPAGGGIEGRVADVAAYGNYAYLTAFREPTCEAGGAHTIDISNPARPAEIKTAFMPTTPGSYAGEGAQTLRLKTASFDGVLFIHQNETCLERAGGDRAAHARRDQPLGRHRTPARPGCSRPTPATTPGPRAPPSRRRARPTACSPGSTRPTGGRTSG